MRNLIFILFLSLASCSTETNETASKYEAQTIVQPVYNMNGLYNKVRKNHYVNIQWLTAYGFPYPTSQPHYVTIKQDGVVVADFYTETYNRFSVQVSPQWQSSTFEVTQTLIGVGISALAYITVNKYN